MVVMGNDPLGKLVFQIRMDPSELPTASSPFFEAAIALGAWIELFA